MQEPRLIQRVMRPSWPLAAMLRVGRGTMLSGVRLWMPIGQHSASVLAQPFTPCIPQALRLVLRFCIHLAAASMRIRRNIFWAAPYILFSASKRVAGIPPLRLDLL